MRTLNQFSRLISSRTECGTFFRVESQGRDLRDMLVNVEIYAEDASGEPLAGEYTLEQLSQKDREEITLQFIEYLAGV